MDRVDYEKTIIQNIINEEKAGQLNLEPWYQRRSVWNEQQKAFLINTIFERKPIPAIYVRHSLDIEKGRSIKEVVDGQQRLRSILGYSRDEYPAPHPSHGLKKIRFSDLTKSEKIEFLSTSLSVAYLIEANESDVIDIFGRINSVAKTLNNQEKRNAQFSGEYKRVCLKLASDHLPLWRSLGIFSATQIARMDEIEFISDLVFNFMKGLSDFTPSVLNKVYKEYDENFPEAEVLVRRISVALSTIAGLNPKSIVDTIFHRSPLFFSLLIVLDTLKQTSINKIEAVIAEVDRRFSSDQPINERSRADADFFLACTSTTQRIKQREIRHIYISSFF